MIKSVASKLALGIMSERLAGKIYLQKRKKQVSETKRKSIEERCRKPIHCSEIGSPLNN